MICATGRASGRFSAIGISCLLVIAVGTAFAQSGPTTLQAYALRGPQDSTAKLYLTVLTDGSTPPTQLGAVTVSTAGADAQPRNVGTFTNVDSPGGQAVIDIGDVPLLAALTVQAKIGQAATTQVLNATTAVTEFALNPQSVVVPDFEGFGAQMNMHLYTALNDPTRVGYTGNTPPEDLPNVEQKVADMHPGLSRIFLSPANYDPANQNRMDSFYKTVELAQSVGANVNITWWFLEHPSTNVTVVQANIQKDMQEFADTLVDLITNHHLTCIRQITIQNEVSTVTWLNQNKDLYKEAYQLLDQHLRDAGIRNQIKFVGGDLVQNNQAAWFQYMAANMNDLLDGWSEHIYWDYWDTGKIASRLDGILAIINALPADQRKPLYITEYGVRGVKSYQQVPLKVADPYRSGFMVAVDPGDYIDASGNLINITETNVAAFQQAWFNMVGANDGVVGFSKWDFYHAQYDFGYQDHSLIGYVFGDLAPGQDRWPLRPAYYMEWLMANTTGQHWQVIGTSGTSGAKLITPFRSPNGDLTVFAMSTDQSAADITIGNLARGAQFNVLIWNADGSGTVSNAGTVNAGGNGTVTVHTPASSMVALTTLPATGWRLCRSQGGPCVFGAPTQIPQ